MKNRMSRGFWLIFFGLLFAALHFRYRSFLILPPLFGYLILFAGIRSIVPVQNTPMWRSAGKTNSIVLFLYLLEFIQPFVIATDTVPSMIVLLWTALKLLFVLLTVYAILAGSAEWLRDSGKEELAQQYEKQVSVYVLLFLILALSNLIVIVCSSEIGSILDFIAGVALQMWLLTKVYGLQKAANAVEPIDFAEKSAQKRELTESAAKND